MDQLGAEINRISTATTFAGTKLLDGTFTGSFQVGADATLAASIFHYDEYSIPVTKRYLAEKGVHVRLLPTRG